MVHDIYYDENINHKITTEITIPLHTKVILPETKRSHKPKRQSAASHLN